MPFKKQFFLLAFLFISTFVLPGQNAIDSLRKVLNTASQDTIRMKTMDRLGNSLMRKGEMKEAVVYANKALELAVKLDNKKGISSAYNTLGNIYSELSDVSKSLAYHQKALNIREEMGDQKGIAASYNNIGIIYYNLSDFTRSIEYMQKAMKIQEQLGNKYYVAVSIGNIAVLYDKLGEDSLAMIYQTKSFSIHKELGDKIDMAASLNHLGSLYRVKKKFATSENFLRQALQLAEESDELQSKAETHGNFGILYYDMGKYKEAITEFEIGLELSKQLGDKKIQAEQLTMLGKANKKLKNTPAALIFYRSSYNLAKQIGSLEDQQNAAEGLYELCKEGGNIKEALNYHELLTQLKDSIFNTTKTASFNNLKTQFALDRQEHELKTQAKEELEKKELEKKQQRIIGYIMIVVLVIVLLFSYFLFQRFRITNAQKKIIEEQKLFVEQKNKEVTDSILYAKRIQQALLAHNEFIAEHLPNHFVFYKPKDIVSGDFYWAALAGNAQYFYLAVCDSTGHGVPGAFMSLLNTSFLNEAINEKRLLMPDRIFNHVRERLIAGISQDGAKDGMDGILLRLNKNSGELSYASAQNRSILIRNNEVVELNYDKMPVGKGESKDSFTLQQMKLEKDDMIYLFTDGYADQFGGEKGKKFKYKELKELLLSVNQKPLAEQRVILEQTFESWKGRLEQVDDVCVIGFKV
jgi:serine phosphatase RsbU (regulator of sigma subunit)/Tfp pilus assembly protein PilF